MPRKIKKRGCKGLLQCYCWAQAEAASLPSVPCSPPLQISSLHTVARISHYKHRSEGVTAPARSAGLPQSPAGKGCQGHSFPGQAPPAHSAHWSFACRTASHAWVLCPTLVLLSAVAPTLHAHSYWSSNLPGLKCGTPATRAVGLLGVRMSVWLEFTSHEEQFLFCSVP